MCRARCIRLALPDLYIKRLFLTTSRPGQQGLSKRVNGGGGGVNLPVKECCDLLESTLEKKGKTRRDILADSHMDL